MLTSRVIAQGLDRDVVGVGEALDALRVGDPDAGTGLIRIVIGDHRRSIHAPIAIALAAATTPDRMSRGSQGLGQGRGLVVRTGQLHVAVIDDLQVVVAILLAGMVMVRPLIRRDLDQLLGTVPGRARVGVRDLHPDLVPNVGPVLVHQPSDHAPRLSQGPGRVLCRKLRKRARRLPNITVRMRSKSPWKVESLSITVKVLPVTSRSITLLHYCKRSPVLFLAVLGALM